MKLWSPVVSAKAWIFSCGTSIHDEGPNSAPASIALMRKTLRGLLDLLVGLVARIRAAARDERRADALRDALLRDHALRDVAPRRQLEHHVEQRALDDGAQPARAGLALERAVGDLPHRVVGEYELDPVVAEEPLVLLDERILGLLEDLHEVLAPQLVHGRDDRQASDELRDQPKVEEVLRHHVGEQLRRLDVVLRADVCPEAEGVLADPLGDDLVQPRERAAADEEDVRRVDREELLVRVLAAALRRHRGHRSLEDLQERLLHALARHVARDRRVVRLARDLVDLIDVDDPGLGLLDVEVRGLDQLQQDVLDVLADVASLGQRRRIGDRERHVQDPRERLREQSLAAAGRSEQEDVRLLELDLVVLRPHLDALVVVVDRDGERPLRLLLGDDVVVENGVDVARARQVVEVELGRARQLLVDDLVAEIDALVADVDARAGDELLHLALALAAKTAEKLLVAVGCACHISSSTSLRPFRLRPNDLTVRDHLVDDAVLLSFFGRHVVVALHVLRDLVDGLVRVLGDDLLQAPLEADRLLGLDLDVGALALEAAGYLVDQDLGVRQRRPLSLRAGGEKQRAHRHRDPDTRRRNVRLDELDGVVNREPRVDGAARRVDVDVDVLVRILGFEVDHLGDDEVRDLVVDRRAEEDDPLVEQARVDIEGALPARGLLNDGRNDEIRGRVHDRAPWLCCWSGVQSFVSVGGFSLSGVQIASRASACASGMRLTSAATRSSASRSCRSSRSVSKRPLSRRLTSIWSASSPRTSSRPTDRCASSRRRATSSSGCWPVIARNVSSWTPRLSTCRANPLSSSRVRASTSGPAASNFEAPTSASATSERNRVSTSSSICSCSRDSMSARSSASVSNSLAERARSSSSGGSIFSLISLTVAVTDWVEPSASSKEISFVSPAVIPTRLRSISSTTAPRPSSTT